MVNRQFGMSHAYPTGILLQIATPLKVEKKTIITTIILLYPLLQNSISISAVLVL